MSEKRFQVSANQIGEIIVIDTSKDNVYGYGNISAFFGLIRILNELNDENEQLRQKLDFYLLDEFEWKEKYGD